MFAHKLCERFLNVEAFAEVDLHISDFSFGARRWLVEHDTGMGDEGTLAFRACGHEDGTHAGLETDADSLDVGLDILHGVIDSEAIVHTAAGAVDVELYIARVVFVGEVKELGDDEIGGVVGNLLAEEDDTLFKEAAVNVVSALTIWRAFNDGGDEIVIHTASITKN